MGTSDPAVRKVSAGRGPKEIADQDLVLIAEHSSQHETFDWLPRKRSLPPPPV